MATGDSDPDLKYNLRTSSIISRLKGGCASAEPRERARPAPLSKYRRRTANARERGRMQLMSETLEHIRRMVPLEVHGAEELKPTKINTLRLAINYIRVLREILGYGPEERVPLELQPVEVLMAQSHRDLHATAEVTSMEVVDVNNNDVKVSKVSSPEGDQDVKVEQSSNCVVSEASDLETELDQILKEVKDIPLMETTSCSGEPMTSQFVKKETDDTIDKLLPESSYDSDMSASESKASSVTSSEDGEQRLCAFDLLEGDVLFECDLSEVLDLNIKQDNLLEVDSILDTAGCGHPLAEPQIT